MGKSRGVGPDFQAAAVFFERRHGVFGFEASLCWVLLRAAFVKGESGNMAADQNKGDVPPFLLRLLQSAAAHHCSGDLKNAEAGYLRLLDHGYRKADILLLLARVVANEGDLEKAVGHLDQMLELAPHHLDALIERAHCFTAAEGR